MEDFASVYELWNDYIEGDVPRYELRNITRYSKYIISIYHWLETEVRWRVNPGYNYLILKKEPYATKNNEPATEFYISTMFTIK